MSESFEIYQNLYEKCVIYIHMHYCEVKYYLLFFYQV